MSNSWKNVSRTAAFAVAAIAALSGELQAHAAMNSSRDVQLINTAVAKRIGVKTNIIGEDGKACGVEVEKCYTNVSFIVDGETLWSQQFVFDRKQEFKQTGTGLQPMP